jgi:general secretion pathway protein D
MPAPAKKTSMVSGSTAGGEILVSETTKIIPDEITNSIIILATPDDYAVIEDAIKKIDIVPRQVMLEALVAEIKLTDDMTFGLSWSLKTDVKIDDTINLDGNLGFNSSNLSGIDVTSLAGFAFAGVDTSGVVRALLETLASDSKINVLAAPHVLVSDNREAKIQIGDQVPIATSETNVSGTSEIQRTIQYKDTGIILTVKPQVNESGLVALEISQEVSSFSIQKIFDSDQVVISKREASTNLVVQDGQTIVIGGLIREDTSRSREGIPLLSKIPILGYLFGSTTDKFTRTELIILLTPHVIRNQTEAADVSSEYIKRLQNVENEELQRKGLLKDGPQPGQDSDVTDINKRD